MLYLINTPKRNQQKMQKIPSTNPPLSPRSHAFPLKLKGSLASIKNATNFSTHFSNNEVSPTNKHYEKQRLQIFKQYKPRRTFQMQDEETVLYRMGRKTISSEEKRDDIPEKKQHQFELQKKLNTYGSQDQFESRTTNRRHKIFSDKKYQKPNQYQLTFKSSHIPKVQQLITTQRLRQNIQALLPATIEKANENSYLAQHNDSNIEVTNIRNQQIIYSRSSSATKLNSNRPQIPLINLSGDKTLQNPKNVILSPTKITFSYQNPQNTVPIQTSIAMSNIAHYRQPVHNIQTVENANNYQPRTKQLFLNFNKIRQDYTTPAEQLTNEKEINFKTAQFKRNNGLNTNKTGSWGNKIRTELMGPKVSQEKTTKSKDGVASKVSLNLCRESIIVNGQKIARQNLKLNQSLSNVSDDQSSKRYFDEDVDLLPPIKRISYNNIDLSRDEQMEEQELFGPNQLLLDIEETHRQEEIAMIEKPVNSFIKILPSPTSAKKKEKFILEELVHQIKHQQIKNSTKASNKYIPVLLVVLASTLLIIQTIF